MPEGMDKKEGAMSKIVSLRGKDAMNYVENLQSMAAEIVSDIRTADNAEPVLGTYADIKGTYAEDEFRQRAEQAEAALADVKAASHMPDDYEFGLPSWINQQLYGKLIAWTDVDGRPIRRSEDIEELIRLRRELAERTAERDGLMSQLNTAADVEGLLMRERDGLAAQVEGMREALLLHDTITDHEERCFACGMGQECERLMELEGEFLDAKDTALHTGADTPESEEQ